MHVRMCLCKNDPPMSFRRYRCTQVYGCTYVFVYVCPSRYLAQQPLYAGVCMYVCIAVKAIDGSRNAQMHDCTYVCMAVKASETTAIFPPSHSHAHFSTSSMHACLLHPRMDDFFSHLNQKKQRHPGWQVYYT